MLGPARGDILSHLLGHWQDFLDVARLVFRGKLEPEVWRVYPLEQPAEAEEQLEKRQHFGQLVVEVGRHPRSTPSTHP